MTTVIIKFVIKTRDHEFSEYVESEISTMLEEVVESIGLYRMQ